MADTSGLVTLDYIVSSYLNWKGITSTGNMFRYKQILIEGFAELNLFHTTYLNNHIGQVNAVNQMTLPSDYVDWVLIAVEVQGKYWSLDENTNLIVSPQDTCGVTVVFDEHLEVPEIVGSKYTRKRRNPLGEFVIDPKFRIVQFKGQLQGANIYLLYTSTGVTVEGTQFVPRKYLMVLRTYLEWQLKEANDALAGAIKGRAEQKFGDQLNLLYEMENDLSYRELITLFRDGLTQGVKR